MASIDKTAEGLHAAGVLDNQTMRKFEARRRQKQKFALFRASSQFDASRMSSWPVGCSLDLNKAALPWQLRRMAGIRNMSGQKN